MNILHILSQKELTGAEVYASALIDTQTSSHRVYQISNGFFKKNTAEQIPLKVETNSLLEFWKSVFSLRKFLKNQKIHVIHAHSRAASKMAFYARIGLRIGYVSTVHGRQHVSFSKKVFNQYGDFAVAVCEKIAEQLSDEFKYNTRRIKTIPNPIDSQKFIFSPPRTKSNESNIYNIAIIGRTSGPKKNRTEVFIKNFSKILNKKNIQHTFTLIGGTVRLETEKNISVQYKQIPEISSMELQKYDLICGSGRVCIEALISGVPCIAFGEAKYIGLIHPGNFQSAAESNFGDVGENFNLPVFNEIQAQQDIDLWLNKKNNYAEVSELALKKYSLKTIQHKILRLYESAYFIRNYKQGIPILMYHKIPDQDLQSQHKIYVNKLNFEKHLYFFKKQNFTSLTFNELSLFRKGFRDWSLFPQKPIILTFDDGYEDNIRNADALLKKFNFSAQIYLLADPHISSNQWDYKDNNLVLEKSDIVSGENRQLWKKTNFVIGSHGLTHQRLPPMSATQKAYELSESKIKLETEFKQPIISYAYTYGDTNPECAEIAQEMGYEYALNTDSGGLYLEEDPYAIFRVNIFPDESLFSLWKKTRPWYRRYYYYKRKK